MINENFVILGAIFNLIGGVSYISDTIKGKIKPNRVSWLLWGIAPMIAFAAEIKEGVGIQSLMTFIVGFTPLMIFIASFVNKKSYWKIGKFDIFCGLLSVLGLILWYLTKTGNIAILFSIFSDFVAGIPTIIKAHKYPETENYIEFSFSFVNASLTLLTMKIFNFANLAFPFYIFFFDLVMIMLIKFKLGKVLAKLATLKTN